MKSRLWIIGTPLSDESSLSLEAKARLADTDYIVGESRSRTLTLLKEIANLPGKEVYFLDPPHPHQRLALFEGLEKAAAEGKDIALFSDTGMPISFDPGIELLDWARNKPLEIRSLPTATSWGTAVALSGYQPPLTLVGFPPRESQERDRFFSEMKQRPEAMVLLETPYRFQKLMQELAEKLPADREVFLAWELASQTERLLWFPIKDWKRNTSPYGLEKGEFILIVGPKSKTKLSKSGAQR